MALPPNGAGGVWVLFGAVNDSAGLALHEGAVGVQFVNDELEGTQDLSFVFRSNIFVVETEILARVGLSSYWIRTHSEKLPCVAGGKVLV
jgi:hypothetical protein